MSLAFVSFVPLWFSFIHALLCVLRAPVIFHSLEIKL
jgi:hypothetical protein